MSSYYMLDSFGSGPEGEAQVAIVSTLSESWFAGSRFTKPVPDPVECEVVRGGDMISMFHGAGLLMRDDLLEAMREAGVDNLDVYNAIIRREKTGETWTNYKAVNVIGVVSAANMDESKTPGRTTDLITVPFESLVIDESKTGGALLFRLAEAVGGLVVHESVKEHLEAAGFDDLSFTEPEEWVG
jgi:hypothetical protein